MRLGLLLSLHALPGSAAAEPAAARLAVCPPSLTTPTPLSPTPPPAANPDDVLSAHGSVHEAQAAARALVERGHAGDIIIELCHGAHPTSQALVLGPRDVPAAGRTVEYRGPRGGAATLDAGLPVTGWKPSKIDGVWKASIPAGTESRQLWVDGRRAPRHCGSWAHC